MMASLVFDLQANHNTLYPVWILRYNQDRMEMVYMPIGEARRKANERYNAKAYDEIKVHVPKGHKAELQAHAEQQNESLNGFINRAIDTQLERDNRTATEIIEQDYLPLEQTIVNQFRNEGTSDEEILQFLREFS